ncbi:MAG: NAD(P)/FAD-dependent oxidoreductase [Paracoccaceae bacterium]
MKIAVIGAGISGLGAALALSERHEVRVFEREDRIGGHAYTVEARFADGPQRVDTGFIVYNYHNYPNLTAMFEHLDVPTRWSDMSFGFSLDDGACEYACDSISKIFAQRWRVMDPRFLQTFTEIIRFTKVAPKDLESGALSGKSLGDWLQDRRFSRWFRERFLLPMGGAIWSTCVADVLNFPAESFIRFFVNHDLMTGLDPARRWRTVDGGSQEYVQRLVARLGMRVNTGREVVKVAQRGAQPEIRFADGTTECFDQVVMAVHGPTARRLLSDPDGQQRAALAPFQTSSNKAVLHSDPALMPKRRRVWSSWNFLSDGNVARPAPVTYWMNRLQGVPEHRPLFVSLNPSRAPAVELVHGTYSYDHPLFDTASFAGQKQMDAIQGRRGIWFAGAWLGMGFHEDGLRSGVRIAEALGARPDWVRDTGTPLGLPVLHAAE